MISPPTISGRCARVTPGNGDATTAIQRALDDVFLAGGGTVVIEPGIHCVRGLRVRSNTTLHLRSGAVLEASRDPEDFDVLANDALEPVPPEEFAPGVVWQPAATRKTHDHLLRSASRWNNAIIRLYRAHDAKIIGEPGSVIDGRDSYDPLGEEGFRGVHGIAAHDCENLELRGYEIRNTGNWAHSFWRCRDVAFSGLTILGGHDGIQRLRDKGHRWEGDGINQLIPCAITCGLIGHPFICPDMIGGGEWSFNFLPGFRVDEELFVRMAQCSALFPMMQFSWAPWRVLSEENVRYCAEAAELHRKLSGEILDLVRRAEENGEPILRALEYNAPHEGLASVRDEFMLGEEILAAPVVTKGARERTVLFPRGRWQGEDGVIYDMTEKQSAVIPAPLSKLLWFRRIRDCATR